MLGQAQTLFLKQGGKLPFTLHERSHWPFLLEMVQKQRLGYVDYALAERLLRPFTNAGQEAAAFLCFLSLAARQGHLCVRVENADILPDPRELLQEARLDEELFSEQDADNDDRQFAELALQGASLLPEKLISRIEHGDAAATPVCIWKNLFYWQRYWVEESRCLNHFQRLLAQNPELKIPDEKVNALLSTQQALLPEQSQAIKQALGSCFTILSGGPGTGKTYTAGRFIQLLWQLIHPEERARIEIVVAAPTGKAVANLQSSLNRAVSLLEGFRPITAKTLHALLGINSFGNTKSSRSSLSADVILVDESSMIDAEMMACLLEAVKDGARLILLGDPYQLPPVEIGSVFADMIKRCELEKLPNLSQLKTCMRAELKTIVDFSSAILAGDSDTVSHLLASQVIQRNELGEDIVKHALPHFTQLAALISSPADLWKAMRSLVLLSPLRHGPFGVETLNSLFLDALMQKKTSSLCLPIIIKRNRPDQKLYNGDVGLLVLPKGKKGTWIFSEDDYALFPESDGQWRRLPALLLPPHDFAFCLSVHKSQGSEFDHVLLLLPEGSDVFGREMLYTGVTRAKRGVEIWGSLAMIDKILTHQGQRLSRLSANT